MKKLLLMSAIIMSVAGTSSAYAMKAGQCLSFCAVIYGGKDERMLRYDCYDRCLSVITEGGTSPSVLV